MIRGTTIGMGRLAGAAVIALLGLGPASAQTAAPATAPTTASVEPEEPFTHTLPDWSPHWGLVRGGWENGGTRIWKFSAMSRKFRQNLFSNQLNRLQYGCMRQTAEIHDHEKVSKPALLIETCYSYYLVGISDRQKILFHQFFERSLLCVKTCAHISIHKWTRKRPCDVRAFCAIRM